MKKIYTLFMVSAIALTANAQLVINENFTSYTTGNLGTQGGWLQVGSGTDVQVKNTSQLTYSGYTSGTNYITVDNVSSLSPYKPFSVNVPADVTQTIYMSYLVRVTNAPEFNQSPVYSVSLANSSNSTFPCEFYVAEKNGASTNIEFGIAVGSSNPVYTSGNYSYNTTYLIVIRYDVVTGTSNDKAYLWVNPSLAAEPSTASPDASQTGTGEVAYGTIMNALKINQTNTIGSIDASYDGFRVANSATSAAAWVNLSPQGAPLPVQLTSFNASQDGMTTKLVWSTAEESGITSYVVEKSTDGRTFTAIGSIAAAGQKTYNFTDAQPASDYTYYRLKIVEMDGTYKLSYIVSLKSKLSLNITLSPNPVRNVLMIQHPKVATDGHIQIVSANGMLIKDLRLPANAVLSNVDMSGFASGLYHVVFKSGTDLFTKTVIKQ
jgi:hypothetical protein